MPGNLKSSGSAVNTKHLHEVAGMGVQLATSEVAVPLPFLVGFYVSQRDDYDAGYFAVANLLPLVVARVAKETSSRDAVIEALQRGGRGIVRMRDMMRVDGWDISQTHKVGRMMHKWAMDGLKRLT